MSSKEQRRAVIQAIGRLCSAVSAKNRQEVLRLTARPLRASLLAAIDHEDVEMTFGGPFSVAVDENIATVFFNSQNNPAATMYAVLIKPKSENREPWLTIEIGARDTGMTGWSGLTMETGPASEISRKFLDEDEEVLAKDIRDADPYAALHQEIDWSNPLYVLESEDGLDYTVGDVLAEIQNYDESDLIKIARTNETWPGIYLKTVYPKSWLRVGNS